jgi:hypothetical protein
MYDEKEEVKTIQQEDISPPAVINTLTKKNRLLAI